LDRLDVYQEVTPTRSAPAQGYPRAAPPPCHHANACGHGMWCRAGAAFGGRPLRRRALRRTAAPSVRGVHPWARLRRGQSRLRLEPGRDLAEQREAACLRG
jgi:hypothetical protein